MADDLMTMAPETKAVMQPDSSAASPEAPSEANGGLTRRSFLSHLGAAGIVATTAPVMAAAATLPAAPALDEPATASSTVPVTLTVNGQQHALQLDPRTTLLDCLRENLNMPGTKKGCDHGQCGACTVHVNGQRVNSCLSFAVMHGRDEITTIEGLGQPGNLHPVQAAFVEHDAYQCGYCTSGQIMSAAALKNEGAKLETTEDVQKVMYGNICRCGAYPKIVAAVQAAYRNA
jgi:xanthine dehydrogenase YagT iron-sulfur-binding subunit